MIARALEAVVFLSLATGMLVGLWAAAPQSTGGASAGGPGQATLTLAAAAPQQAALVRVWQQPAGPALQTPRPQLISRRAQMPPRPVAPQAGPTLPPAPALPAVLPVALPGTPPQQALRPTRPVPETPKQPQALPNPEPTPNAPADASTPRRAALAKPAAPPPDAPPDAPPVANTAPPPPPLPPRLPAPEKSAPPKPETTARATARPADGGAVAQNATGKSGRDATQSSDAATRNAIQARWGARIQRRVHRWMIYPRGATGTGGARIELRLNRAGKLTGLRLLRSSGSALFDKAALRAVQRARRFPAAPKALTRPSYTFTLSLTFRP
jgi:periplasmic protein TonB